jgi:superfamily II DNA/RNA helicase
VVVAAPSNALELMKRGLNTEYLKFCVLDDAHELLTRDSAPQIQAIFRFLPGDIQMLLFSATVSKKMLSISSIFMRDPAQI